MSVRAGPRAAASVGWVEQDEPQEWRSRRGYLPLFLGIAALGGVVGGWGSGQFLAGAICFVIAALLFALSWHLYDRAEVRRGRPRHRR
jgi:hypothetical protein